MTSRSKFRLAGVGSEKLRRFEDSILYFGTSLKLESRPDIWKKYKLLALIYLNTSRLFDQCIAVFSVSLFVTSNVKYGYGECIHLPIEFGCMENAYHSEIRRD